MKVETVALAVSPVHAYEGPAGRTAGGPAPRCGVGGDGTAGLGLVGDRYFNQPIHRRAAVTFFDAAALDELVVGA